MSNIAAIALSGMNAAVKRVEVSAGNVANQRTNGRMPKADGSVTAEEPQAYTPLRVDQVETTGGTQANISAVSPATVPVYDSEASYADAQGMVAAPNVDLSSEMVEQIVASYRFAANARVLKAGDSLAKTLLDMKV